MHNLVASADLFLNPTLYEGSSLVTLEAMAHGVPIVATSAGGIPDKIREGETGWVAPPGNAEALAAALRRWLAATRGEQRRRGEAARRLCETRFDWSVAAERWERTIRDLSGL
jgi:glycosyltransferase involved in cell wall biosynthesis